MHSNYLVYRQETKKDNKVWLNREVHLQLTHLKYLCKHAISFTKRTASVRWPFEARWQHHLWLQNISYNIQNFIMDSIKVKKLAKSVACQQVAVNYSSSDGNSYLALWLTQWEHLLTMHYWVTLMLFFTRTFVACSSRVLNTISWHSWCRIFI